MKNKTKKSPTGAPLGNPLKYFREGGEKRMAAYKKGGYNVPKNSLPRRDNGGPGSGMGSMYKNDQAFDSMMNQTSEPNLSKELNNRYANMEPVMGKPTNAMRANQSINQVSPEDALRKAQESNAINAKKASFQDLKKRYDNTAPVISKPPGVRQGLTLEQMSLLNSKKGGSVKRKKK